MPCGESPGFSANSLLQRLHAVIQFPVSYTHLTLPTIEAKKFYEVQKYTMLTGHITESLVTVVSGTTWSSMPAADRKLFDQVLWEASTRASSDILESEHRLVTEFEKAGRTIVKVDRKPFMQAVQKAVTAPDAPWSKELYDRVEALK